MKRLYLTPTVLLTISLLILASTTLYPVLSQQNQPDPGIPDTAYVFVIKYQCGFIEQEAGWINPESYFVAMKPQQLLTDEEERRQGYIERESWVVEPGEDPTTGIPVGTLGKLKEGDYAVNINLYNKDPQDPTRELQIIMIQEWPFPLSQGGIDPETEMWDWVTLSELGHDKDWLNPGEYFQIDCDIIQDFIIDRELDSPEFRQVGTGETDDFIPFSKGLIIIYQPVGDPEDEPPTTGFPIDVTVTYSYEVILNKVMFRIIKDPTHTIPREYLRKILEMVYAFPPEAKAERWWMQDQRADFWRIEDWIRDEITDQWGPETGRRALIRIYDIDVSTGGSIDVEKIPHQTVTVHLGDAVPQILAR